MRPLIVAAAALAACGARTSLDVGPRIAESDAADVAEDSALDVVPDAGVCTFVLTIVDLEYSSAGCFPGQVPTDEPGTLTYPCSGGAATVRLGPVAFAGDVHANHVVLMGTTRFMESDGCMWQSTQSIVGDLPNSLDFAYSEMSLPGHPNCFLPCPSGTHAVVLVR